MVCMDRDAKEALNALLTRIKEGDEGAVAEVHDIMAPTVRYIALKYLSDADEADDSVQDFWLGIRDYARGFRVRKNAFSYLCRIMTRIAINRYRQLNRHRDIEVRYVDYTEVACADDSTEAVALRADVEAAMKKLTTTQRIVIQQTVFEDMTVRQSAKILGKSKTQIARLKNSATEILKRELCADERDK